MSIEDKTEDEGEGEDEERLRSFEELSGQPLRAPRFHEFLSNGRLQPHFIDEPTPPARDRPEWPTRSAGDQTVHAYDLDFRREGKSLAAVVFDDFFYEQIANGGLEDLDSVEYIHFGANFNADLKHRNAPPGLCMLPKGLKTLEFKSFDGRRTKFNRPLHPGAIPTGLLRLSLGDAFNQPIDRPGYFGRFLRYLCLGDGFDSRINFLPDTLQYLKIGDTFNQAIDNDLLPEGLLELQLGRAYSRPINPAIERVSKLDRLVVQNDKALFLYSDLRFAEPLNDKVRELYVSADFSRRHSLGTAPNVMVQTFEDPADIPALMDRITTIPTRADGPRRRLGTYVGGGRDPFESFAS